MNIQEEQIESILRTPPGTKIPAGLKERLVADVPISMAREYPAPGLANANGSSRPALPAEPPSWLRRWLPLLLPAGLSAACGIVLALQRLEINDLKKNIQLISPAATSTSSVQATSENSSAVAAATPESNPANELDRLRDTAAKLRKEVSSLELLAGENQKLRDQLSHPAPVAGLTADESSALQKAKERAQRIQCVNNLKQIGLAVRVWSLDEQDRIAPDFLSMSNELSTPKILVCPGDTSRVAASDWNSLTSANISYEYFTGDITTAAPPNRLLTRCPIHGSIGLLDGSVQMSVMKNHPESVIRKEDGQLYMIETPAPAATPNPGNPTP